MDSSSPRIQDIVEETRRRLADYHPGSHPRDGLKAAAVLLLLYPKDDEICLLFTRRSETVQDHKGQMSFPGGSVHAADQDLAATALRETYEEVGINPDDVEIIGRLDEVRTVSDFHVTPFVGVMKQPPARFVPNALEVAEVIEVPVSHLLNPAFTFQEQIGEEGRRHVAYRFDDHRIWGVTARMLKGFLDIMLAEGPAPTVHRGGGRG